MHRWLPELVAYPLFPLLLAQGAHARRVTPRLPEAPPPHEGVAGQDAPHAPLSLLAIGESPVAGVGVATHAEGITGQLAHALAARLRRPVAWRACGRNGITAREATAEIVPRLPRAPVDLALVALGVNDATAFRSLSHWRADLRALVERLDRQCSPRLILLSGLPPVAHFPALPQPLRWVMGLKSASFDHAAREMAPALPRTCYVPLVVDPGDAELLASDGYHPSAKGCAAWARLLADVGAARLGNSAAGI